MVGITHKRVVTQAEEDAGAPVIFREQWNDDHKIEGMVKQTQVDFGLVPYLSEKDFTITDPDVKPTSRITGNIAYEAPTGKDLDELEMDAIELKFGPGDGQLTIHVAGLEGSLEGNFKINYLIG